MPVRRLLGKGRLPKIENVNKLSPEQVRRVLERFGINATDIRNQMLREFARPAARLRWALREGKPDEALVNQLKGQIKRIRESVARRMLRKAIGDFKMERARLAMIEQGVKNPEGKRFWVWVAKMDAGTCPSCIRRHLVVKTLNQWRVLGLPKSPQLICDGNCRCDLYPRPGLEDYKLPKSGDGLRSQLRSPREGERIWEETRKFRRQVLKELKDTQKALEEEGAS